MRLVDGARVLTIAASLAVPGCIFFSDFDGLSGGSKNGAGGGASDASCSASQIKLCQGIPSAPGFQQQVDAVGDEFCEIPAHIFIPHQGEFQHCGAPAQFIENHEIVARVQVAWSEEALHFFVRVEKDPSLPIEPDQDEPWKKDAVELFIANTPSPSGNVGEDNAQHLTIAPPSEGGATGYIASLAPFEGEWQSRRMTGAYEVEVRIPWSELGGPAPASGSVVWFNFGLDVMGPAGERYQSFLRYTTADGGTRFCHDLNDYTTPTPGESTLTWCPTELQ